ncbi:MAG TPA: type II toxin-antitoxin system VapC family toxin [Thermoanaerobaculia bacterium]|nr:type II toxin-antitoxin system VapC family toxin [Thermoanaerobaculia bacterium]
MILDSSPIVAILTGETDAELYIQAISRAARCRISAGNFIELSIVLESQFPVEVLRQCDALFRRVGIVIEPVTVEHAHLARQAFHDFGKGRHPAGLNFGDCFAYALAKQTGEPLLFKGNDFSQTDVVSAL